MKFCIFFTVSLLWALQLHGSPAENQVLEVYGLGFADPAVLVEVAETIVGTNGSVMLNRPNARLLVVTTEERHEQLRELVNELNTPPPNVRIMVEFNDRQQRRVSGVGMDADGEVIILPGGSSGTIKLEPRLHDSFSTDHSYTRQTLTVMSGRKALLKVGESVPYLDWIMSYGFRHRTVEAEVAWQEVGAFLAVEPRVIGEGPAVQIRLVPELRGLVDGRPHHVAYTAAATEVTAMHGESIQIGGHTGDDSFYKRFLVGVDQENQSQQLTITLTPEIMPPLSRKGTH